MDEAGKGAPPAFAEIRREHGIRYYPGRCCPRSAPWPPGPRAPEPRQGGYKFSPDYMMRIFAPEYAPSSVMAIIPLFLWNYDYTKIEFLFCFIPKWEERFLCLETSQSVTVDS